MLNIKMMNKYAEQMYKICFFSLKKIKALTYIGLGLFLQFLWVNAAQAAPELNHVRVGQHLDKSRVVFEIKRNQGFEIHTLDHPPRVVVDFKKAQNHLTFTRKKFKEDRFIQRVRVKNQLHRPEKRIRVVLDLKRSVDYRYFTLGKNARGNERVVIDLFTKPVQQAKTAKKPAKKQPKVLAKVKKVKSKTKVAKKAKPIQVVSKTSNSKPVARQHPTHPHPAFDSETQALLKNFTQAPLHKKKTLVVAIDPGHGGKDTGAIGPHKTYEKTVTLAIAKRLKRYIDAQPGMRAVLTRDRDIFIPLKKRVEIAHRKHADLFVSIHADSYPAKKVRGGSVYVLSTKGASSLMAKLLANSENANLMDPKLLSQKNKDVAFALSDMAREANIRASRKLAQNVLFEMQKSVAVHKHQVQSANFAVLKSIDIPSLLIETAFISNPSEERKLTKRYFQTKLAKSIVRGVKRFVHNRADEPIWGETMFVHYRVQKGDTLSEIAANYKISVKQLKRLNHIQNANQLYAGKKLRIPLNGKLLAGL
ncbi:N-acetylmuramoyl-L-alanine amidase [Galenea microaerophila]